MNVFELIEELNRLPSDLTVVMSKDAEGNRYSPLARLEPGKYLAESTWAGEMVHPDDEGDYDGLTDVVCLWPVN